MIEGWSGLDLAAGGIILGSTVAALFKGLAASLISLGSVVAGVALALLFHPAAAALLARLGVGQPLDLLLGFAAIFCGSLVAGAVLIRLADSVLQALFLKWADRMFGAAFGLLRGWLIVTVGVMALAAFSVANPLLAQSRTGAFFLASADFLTEVAPEDFRSRFEQGYEEIYQRWIEGDGQGDGLP